ncbi:hypothetical protein MKSMC1_29190 [Mycobacterium kansasii]|nr:hypothetical protein MKSMC1_29190 [Mycobacterium kansasii]
MATHATLVRSIGRSIARRTVRLLTYCAPLFGRDATDLATGCRPRPR